MNHNGKGPYSTVMIITPAQAAEWLTRNKNNRSINRIRVNKYRRDMAANAWDLTGDSIGIDEDNFVTNGQHRLTACVEAGEPFRSLVTFGLPSSKHQDRGALRTLGNVVQLELGVKKYAQKYAGAAKWYRLLCADINGASRYIAAMRAMTDDEMLETLNETPELREALDMIMNDRMLRTYVRPHPMIAALYVLLARADAVIATELFEVLRTGEGVPTARLLRDYMVARRKKAGLTQDEAHELVSKVVVTFKAMREGRDLQILRKHKTITPVGARQ